MKTRHPRATPYLHSTSTTAGLSTFGVVATLFGVCCAVALGWWYTGGKGGHETTIDAARIVRVERADLIDAVTANGRVEPIARVAVMSRASGIVEKLYVDEGDAVEQGQILAELDREQLEAQVDRDEADLKSAEARLAAARASVLEAQLQLEDPAIDFLEREAARQEKLFKQNSVSLKEREDSARNLASSRFELDLIRARIPILEASVDEALANLASARAALERSRTTLSETTIRSPIDGVVLVRDKEVGDGVSSILTAGGNATQIMSLGDLSRMHIEARIDEVDLGRIRVGMATLITIDAYRGKELTGRVERIAPAGSIDDNGIVTFQVRIVVDDPEELLRPDMTADAKLVIDRRDGVLVLPQRALVRGGDGTWSVQRVTGEVGGEHGSKNGTQHIETIPVEIGLSDGLKTEVVGELSEGDRVLVQASSPRGRR